jgi:hypothetical protein
LPADPRVAYGASEPHAEDTTFVTFTPTSRFEDQLDEVSDRLERCRDVEQVDALMAALDTPTARAVVGHRLNYLIGAAKGHRQYLAAVSAR